MAKSIERMQRAMRCKTMAEIEREIYNREHENELKQRFLNTLEKSAFIGITAKSMEISERVVNRWMREDPIFADNVRAAQARVAERVGLSLIAKALQDNDTQAQIFICKTLGRNLGFDERQPMVNINVGNTDSVDVSALSATEKEQMLSLMRKAKQEAVQGVIDTDFIVDDGYGKEDTDASSEDSV